MIQAKCIQKFRDKTEKIYGYRLIDLNGQTQDVMSDNLKQAIRNKQIQVVNLTLTSDGRLVDKASDNLKSSKLGEAPVQKQSREDAFIGAVNKIVENFCKNVGGKFNWYDDDGDNRGYMGIVQEAYYSEKSSNSVNNYHDNYYGAHISLAYKKGKEAINIEWNDTDGYGKTVFSLHQELKSPLFLKENLIIIKDAFDKFTIKVNKWIYTEKQLQTNNSESSQVKEFQIPKITSSRVLLKVIQDYCETLRADDKRVTYNGYRFHSKCRGGNDYDDATTDVEVDGDKIIVTSHSCYGTDDKEWFTVNEIEEAFKYIKDTDAILTGMY